MKIIKQKRLMIVTERAIEDLILKDIKRLGAKGYSLVDSRGEDQRGLRHAEWEANRDVRIEVLCEEAIAHAIIERLFKAYYDDYDMTIFMSDIDVFVRKEK